MADTRIARVYVILANWNGWRNTIACLQSLESLVYADFEVLVVDNGSTNESVARMRGAFPSVRIVETGENLGFAGANNVGIRIALSEGADYVWLLNNDTLVAPNALSTLVDRAKSDPGIGVVGSKIYYESDPNRLWYAGGEFSRSGWTVHVGMNEIDGGRYDVALPTEYVTGCSILVGVSTINEVGPMFEGFFLYWEDVDWCFRIAQSGWGVMYEPASVVWHKVSMSVGGEANPVKARYEGRNRVLFYRRNRPARAPYIVATTLAQSLWAAFLGRPRVGISMAAGVVDGLCRRTGPIGARK